MSAIVAILNTYAPTTGQNVAQVVIRSDGTVQLFGDEAMARHAVGALVNSPLPPIEPPARAPRDIPPTPRGRRSDTRRSR